MVSETMRVLGAASSSITAFGIVGRVAIVDDRSDHPRVAGAVGFLEQQRVQPVLGGHHLGHLAVGRHHADPADAPVFGESHLQQAVDVHRLMRAVEAADPEMHYADADLVAVIVRLVDRLSRANVALSSFMTPSPLT